MRRAILAALVLTLLLFPAAAVAQHGGGGGGHGGGGGGGGWGGGGHGGGGWGHGGGGWGGGHGGYWGGHGHGYYGGYYGGWRGGYWWPYWGWGWGIGVGWGWGYPYYGYWGWGYPYSGYYGAPAPYGSVYSVPGYWAVIDTGVSPDEARVFLDGQYIGTADDFDGFPDYLYLQKGHYRIEFRLEGFETKVVELDAKPGSKVKIDDKLVKIKGAKQHGSYDTPEVPGGIQRFFGKRPDGSDAVISPGEEGPGGYAPEGSSTSPPPAPPPSGDSSGSWRDRSSGSGVTTVRPGRSHSTRLVIRAMPSDAAVYVDDRFVGTAQEVFEEERGLKVEPGPHTVTVSRPGFKDKTVKVQVEAGQTESVDIGLEH